MSDLDGIRSFVRVAELGSFSAAARELGVSQPTVSKAIAALEGRLGVRLLRRTTRSVGLTDEGAGYHVTCQRLLAELDEAEATLAGGGTEPRGRLRLSAPREHGERLVTPVVLRFLAAHPGMQVDLSLSERRVDLAADGIDVAIRLGALDDSSLRARRLGHFPRVTVAAPSYLEARGAPETPEALAEHDCLLHTALLDPARWRYRDAGGLERRVTVRGRLAATSNYVVLDAALAGLGILRTPRWLVEEALADGRLVPVLERYDTAGLDVHAVYAGGPLVPLKVRAFVDFLREAWAADGIAVE